jgi:hypothetical protein
MRYTIIISIVVLALSLTGCVIKPTHTTGPKRAEPVATTKKKPKKPKPVKPETSVSEYQMDIELLRPGKKSKTAPAPVRGRAIFKKKQLIKSMSCTETEELWFCANDRWFAGENRVTKIENPNSKTKKIIHGTDLGVSVQFGPSKRTIFYMGDTMGKSARTGCGKKAPTGVCNDAIIVAAGTDDKELPANPDPNRGIATGIVVERDENGKIEGFVPLTVDGVNGRNPLPLCKDQKKDDISPCLGAFNVPSGAAVVPMPGRLLPGAQKSGKSSEETVLIWYSTAISVFNNVLGRPQGASYVVTSTDGVHFKKIIKKPFSRNKFIQVAPVFVPRETVKNICKKDASSILCSSKLGGPEDMVLLFGVGEKYRQSPLYLGLMRLSDLAVFYYHFDAGSKAGTWAGSEKDASPIIGKKQKQGLMAKLMSMGKGNKGKAFGELSARLVPATACPVKNQKDCEDTIVVLDNAGGSVHYHTAPLANLGRGSWTPPQVTSASGYGPYIIDAYTRVVQGAGGLELRMFHLISAWDGKPLGGPDHNPYGVFSRPLMLKDMSTCNKKKICDEKAPVWPPSAP